MEMTPIQEVQLQLALAEVNQILDALGDKSYKQVYQLIIKIQQQAENQLQKTNQQAAGPRKSTENTMQ
ncbi:MAG TPA: hypothetical protein VIT23_17565 [Terrimicrobiaceae bacterium]